MSAVGLLRELWRRRRFVAVGVLVAAAAGILIGYHVGPSGISSRQHKVAVASSSALIDTPTSQIVDLGRQASAAGESLPGRATLLASLLTTSPLKDEIARRAGIDPRTLIATAPGADAGAAGQKSTPLATGATVSPDDPRANTITLQTDVTLPIITVNTSSASVQVARALADGTIATLTGHVADLAGRDAVPATQRLSVKPLGAANTAVETRGAGMGIAIGAGLAVFLLICAAIVGISSMAKEWWRTAALEAEARELVLHDASQPPPEVEDRQARLMRGEVA